MEFLIDLIALIILNKHQELCHREAYSPWRPARLRLDEVQAGGSHEIASSVLEYNDFLAMTDFLGFV